MKRAQEIPSLSCEGQLKLFHAGIEPTDIKQGSLGNCYFLSILSSLAETPSRIENLIRTDKTNNFGFYEVRFFVLGKPVQVIVDDYFPCKDD